MAGKAINLTGQVFAHLTVLDRDNDCGNGKKPVVKWRCQCSCGRIVSVRGESLRSGHTKSCGCQKIKHGFSNKERLYQTWKNMRRRCYDPSNKRYALYGGRGIQICPEWEDYRAFRQWAHTNGYNDTLTIDRIDVDGNYCPDNCRWADYKTQANNVSRNRVIEFDGKKMTMSQLAEHLGLSYATLQHRVDRGWDMDKITGTPQRKREHHGTA